MQSKPNSGSILMKGRGWKAMTFGYSTWLNTPWWSIHSRRAFGSPPARLASAFDRRPNGCQQVAQLVAAADPGLHLVPVVVAATSGHHVRCPSPHLAPMRLVHRSSGSATWVSTSWSGTRASTDSTAVAAFPMVSLCPMTTADGIPDQVL